MQVQVKELVHVLVLVLMQVQVKILVLFKVLVQLPEDSAVHLRLPRSHSGSC